jgi:hypothetical protein
VTDVPYKRKSWQEKLEDPKGIPKIVSLETNFPCRRALEKMGAQIGDSYAGESVKKHNYCKNNDDWGYD